MHTRARPGRGLRRLRRLGRQSLAVANDELPGDLLRNDGPTSFANVGVTARDGLTTANGNTHGGMGIDWGDYDNDGRLDLFVATFQERAEVPLPQRGRGPLHRRQLTADWLPADPVRLLRRQVARLRQRRLAGSDDRQRPRPGQHSTPIDPRPHLPAADSALPQQRRHALRGPERAAGPDLRRPLVGRAWRSATSTTTGRGGRAGRGQRGRALLLHNESGARGHWLGLRLVGTGRSNRDGYGAT